jgi:hypothetical protein
MQSELSEARRDLALRTAELETVQERVAESEQRLRAIHGSPSYRLAQRWWRMRIAARERLSRASGSDKEPGVYSTGFSPLAAGTDQENGSGGAAKDGNPRRGSERTRAVAAVWLLGGLTPEQLVHMLRALSRTGPPASRLLVISDCDAFRALDGFGCQYEFIPPREDWEQLLGRDGTEYEGFVRRRLAAIGDAHGVPDLASGQPIATN